MEKNLQDFLDPVAPLGLHRVCKLWLMGSYKGEAFRRWINDQLSRRLDRRSPRFVDLPRPLKVVATDLTLQEAIVFSSQHTPNFPIADAVRMSMGIPFFYVPFRYGSSLVVDGGVLSNFPAWVFLDEQRAAPLPILGLRLQPAAEGPGVRTFLGLAEALAAAVVRAAVALQLQLGQVPGLNLIELPTLGVRTTDFDIKQDKKEELYQAGYNRTLAWLATNPLTLPAGAALGELPLS
jgi:NTE family protein